MHFKAAAGLLLFLLLSCFEATTAVNNFWSFDWLENFFHKMFTSKTTENPNTVALKNLTTDNTASNAGNVTNAVAGGAGGAGGVKRAIFDDEADFFDSEQIPPHCEDAVLVPLAHLKAISPEKIIELITTSNLEQTCGRVSSTVSQVQKAIESCSGFPQDHLYKKLTDGLEEFDNTVCNDVREDMGAVGGPKRDLKKKRLIDYKECLNQLQDELYDCEGPADWFEKRNNSIACQFYNDILDCNYIKAAMLCGKPAARLVRDFSDAVMRKVLTFHCKKSRAVPHVESPMIDSGSYVVKYTETTFTFMALIFYISRYLF